MKKYKTKPYIRVTCSLPDCQETRRRDLYCGKHFQRVKKYGDPYFYRGVSERAGQLPTC